MLSTGMVDRRIFAVDIERSTYRYNPVKQVLRSDLYEILDAGFRGAGIGPDDCDQRFDRGDGALVLIRPVDHVSELRLFEKLIPQLRELVCRHNEGLSGAERPVRGLRLRVVLHAGTVHYDGNGPFGESLDVAFRLLDARPVKARLRESGEPLVLVVSERLYEDVVRHDYPGIEKANFDPLHIVVGGNRQRGWMC